MGSHFAAITLACEPRLIGTIGFVMAIKAVWNLGLVYSVRFVGDFMWQLVYRGVGRVFKGRRGVKHASISEKEGQGLKRTGATGSDVVPAQSL